VKPLGPIFAHASEFRSMSMRARHRILSALAGVMALAGQAFAGPLSIEANKTEPLRFKRPVASIVIGNPLVVRI